MPFNELVSQFTTQYGALGILIGLVAFALYVEITNRKNRDKTNVMFQETVNTIAIDERKERLEQSQRLRKVTDDLANEKALRGLDKEQCQRQINDLEDRLTLVENQLADCLNAVKG